MIGYETGFDGCDGSNFGGFERGNTGDFDADAMIEEGVRRDNLVMIERMKFLVEIRVSRLKKARRRRFSI